MTFTPTHRHYKGNLYQFLHHAKHSETMEDMAVYQGKDGKVWARPLAMFEQRLGDGSQRFDPLPPAFGCFCELLPGDAPERTCIIDTGPKEDCSNAYRYASKGDQIIYRGAVAGYVTSVEDGICHHRLDSQTSDLFIWRFGDGSLNALHDWPGKHLPKQSDMLDMLAGESEALGLYVTNRAETGAD